MKLKDVINNLDKKLAEQETLIAKVKEQKERFLQLQEKFPDAEYKSGHICLPNIWDKITCMRIDRGAGFYYTNEINVRFLLGKKDSVDNMKIFVSPYETKIAKKIVSPRFSGNKVKELQIFDYESIIPIVCPKRKSFIRRIKLYLTNLVVREGLTITNNSFNKAEFEKLLMLK